MKLLNSDLWFFIKDDLIDRKLENIIIDDDKN